MLLHSVGGASAVKQVSLACGPFQLDCLQDVAWFHERYLARRLLKQRTLGPAAEVRLNNLSQDASLA